MKISRLPLCLFFIGPILLTAGPSFAYILQAEKFAAKREAFVKKISDCGREIVVMDCSFDGGSEGAWRPQEIAAMKHGDRRRKIIAYLSIGEAEDYRPYWKKAWRGPRRPDFLLDENPEWKGNYRVRYWRADWQAIVFEYLENIIRQGFDGVYLDIVDGYEFFERGKDNRLNPETKRSYREDMKQLVGNIVKRSKQLSPTFLVIQQNAQALFEDTAYMRLLDGIGAEDVFTDGKRPQKQEDIQETIRYLKKARDKGLLVVVVEYPKQPQLQKRVCAEAAASGLDLLITDRALTKLGKFFSK